MLVQSDIHTNISLEDMNWVPGHSPCSVCILYIVCFLDTSLMELTVGVTLWPCFEYHRLPWTQGPCPPELHSSICFRLLHTAAALDTTTSSNACTPSMQASLLHCTSCDMQDPDSELRVS